MTEPIFSASEASINFDTGGLPIFAARFIGRTALLAEASRLLATCPLLTLTGPAGVGKTRLSLQLAGQPQLISEFPDGVWQVRLSELNERVSVAQAVAQVLGLSVTSDLSLVDTVAAHLHSRRLLLVLDRCEHRLAECAQMLSQWLPSCSGLRVIATSQQPFGLPEEVVLPVPGLDYPTGPTMPALAEVERYEAIRLFVDRARQVQPDFRLTKLNAPLVVKICRRLEGLPLAIELAAWRLQAASVEEVGQDLSYQFDRLGDNLSQETIIRAALDWSYGLLDPAQQLLLNRLAIFRGSWSLEAAQAILPDARLARSQVAPLLKQLVARSLIQTVENGRYRLLSLLREYATLHLRETGEDLALRERMSEWYIQLVKTVELDSIRVGQPGLLARLEAEHSNLREVLRWSLERASGDPTQTETVLQLVGMLWRFWRYKGYWSEGLSWLDAALILSGGTRHSRAWALCGAGILTASNNRYALAQWRLEESLGLFREENDQLGQATATSALGQLALSQDELGRARQLYTESLALSRQIEDWLGAATMLDGLGLIATLEDDYPTAQTFYQQNLALERQLNNRVGSAVSLHHLGELAGRQGDYIQCLGLLKESLSLFEVLNDRRASAWTLNTLGEYDLAQSNFEQARLWLESGLKIYRELADEWGMAFSLHWLGDLSRYQKSYDRAKNLYYEAIDLRQNIATKSGLAQTLQSLSRLYLATADLSAAEAVLRQSYQLFYELNGRRGLADTLESLAAWLSQTDEPQRAIQGLGAATRLRQRYHIPRPPVDQPFYLAIMARVRPQLGPSAFESAWQTGEQADLASFGL